MKVRAGDAFYCPDVMVNCQPVEPNAVYLTEPTLIVEVLSELTEGAIAWRNGLPTAALQTLQEYLLIAQDRESAHTYRRAQDGWNELELGSGDGIDLASVGLRFFLSEL